MLKIIFKKINKYENIKLEQKKKDEKKPRCWQYGSE